MLSRLHWFWIVMPVMLLSALPCPEYTGRNGCIHARRGITRQSTLYLPNHHTPEPIVHSSIALFQNAAGKLSKPVLVWHRGSLDHAGSGRNLVRFAA